MTLPILNGQKVKTKELRVLFRMPVLRPKLVPNQPHLVNLHHTISARFHLEQLRLDSRPFYLDILDQNLRLDHLDDENCFFDCRS